MRLWVLALSIASMTFSTASHASVIALDYVGGSVQSFPNYTVGWTFNVNSTIQVTALDYFQNVHADSHTVGIYTSTGTLLSSAAVNTAASSNPHTLSSTPIIPLILAPGSYVVAGTTGAQGEFEAFASGVTTPPEITYGHGAFLFTSGSLAFPTTTSDRGTAYFGPDFEYSIPEPASLTLIGALSSLALPRRRRRD